MRALISMCCDSHFTDEETEACGTFYTTPYSPMITQLGSLSAWCDSGSSVTHGETTALRRAWAVDNNWLICSDFSSGLVLANRYSVVPLIMVPAFPLRDGREEQ